MPRGIAAWCCCRAGASPGRGRPGAPGAGVLQPAQQRRALHRGAGEVSACRRGARRRGRGLGAGQRHRHPPEMREAIFELFSQLTARSSARTAAWASACRWSGHWSSCTAARSRRGARASARAPNSWCACLPGADPVQPGRAGRRGAAPTGGVPSHPGRRRQPRRRLSLAHPRLLGYEVEVAHDGAARSSATAGSARRRAARHRHAEAERLRGGALDARQPRRARPLIALTGWGQERPAPRHGGGLRLSPHKPVDPGALERHPGGGHPALRPGAALIQWSSDARDVVLGGTAGVGIDPVGHADLGLGFLQRLVGVELLLGAAAARRSASASARVTKGPRSSPLFLCQ